MIKPTLVVMAAGMGSRFGSLKQIEPVGPTGEIIMEYSVHDSIKAGFQKVVFIIKKEKEKDFKEIIGDKISQYIDTAYVYQDINNLPHGYVCPEGRTKPWGTAHAVLTAKDEVNTPFLVINADDFYGKTTFKVIHDYLITLEDNENFYEYSMVGFKLENTLSDNGHVARGVCVIDSNNYLQEINERTQIMKFGDVSKYTEDNCNWVEIPKGSTVSMTAWGFTPSIFLELENRFPKFLEKNNENILKAEYFLPSVVDELLKENKAKVMVLTSNEQWYGVTYKEDKPAIINAINDLVKNHVYEENLWGDIK